MSLVILPVESNLIFHPEYGMPPFQLALFDFDGTLADSVDSILYCFVKTFESFGRTAPSPQSIRSTIGMNLGAAFDLLRGDDTSDGSPDWVERYREVLRAEGLSKCRLYPGAAGLLDHLSRQGVDMAVVSHRKAEFIYILLDQFGLKDKVSLVVGGHPEPYLKPDPRVFDKLVQPHFNGIQPGKVLVIGDTPYDLEFARNIGAKSCWAAYGYGDEAKCLALSPDYQAASPGEIAGCFDEGVE